MYALVKICSFDSSQYFPPCFHNAPKTRHMITGQTTAGGKVSKTVKERIWIQTVPAK